MLTKASQQQYWFHCSIPVLLLKGVTSGSEGGDSFCSFECLVRALQPQAAAAHTTTKVQAELNVQGAGQKAAAHVAIKTEGSAQIEASIGVSAAASQHAAPPEPEHEALPVVPVVDLEAELETLMEAVEARQPEAEPGTAPNTAAAPPGNNSKERLEELSGLIQNMLRRPNTIDISEVMFRANSLTSEPESESLQQEAAPRRCRLTSKQPPKDAAAPAAAPAELSQKEAPSSSAPAELSQKEALSSATPAELSQKEAPSSATPPELSQREAPSSATPAELSQKERSHKKAPSSGLPAELSQKEAPSSGLPAELSQKEASSGLPAELSQKEAIHQTEAPGSKKVKRSREDESDQDRLAREGHNQYMRFYRSIRPPTALINRIVIIAVQKHIPNSKHPRFAAVSAGGGSQGV